ncbi:hypothetical protein JCM10908_006310 [Rhodotorula pacifica]|uniref:uncharacterized protein n=1 Tax=Rhodotorula pacifica TaxID=1495444 RepID=UPI00318099E5
MDLRVASVNEPMLQFLQRIRPTHVSLNAHGLEDEEALVAGTAFDLPWAPLQHLEISFSTPRDDSSNLFTLIALKSNDGQLASCLSSLVIENEDSEQDSASDEGESAPRTFLQDAAAAFKRSPLRSLEVVSEGVTKLALSSYWSTLERLRLDIDNVFEARSGHHLRDLSTFLLNSPALTHLEINAVTFSSCDCCPFDFFALCELTNEQIEVDMPALNSLLALLRRTGVLSFTLFSGNDDLRWTRRRRDEDFVRERWRKE